MILKFVFGESGQKKRERRFWRRVGHEALACEVSRSRSRRGKGKLRKRLMGREIWDGEMGNIDLMEVRWTDVLAVGRGEDNMTCRFFDGLFLGRRFCSWVGCGKWRLRVQEWEGEVTDVGRWGGHVIRRIF